MAIATHSTTHSKPAGKAHPPTHTAPVTPGKVAMWLFLATEVMFFTGLIGSYIVLRAGSPHNAYSNLYSPNTPLQGLENTEGVLIKSLGASETQVEEILHSAAGKTPEEAEEIVEQVHHSGHALISELTPAKAETLKARLEQAGAGHGDRAAQDVQLAPALRRSDQPPGHQPDGRQHLRPDLLLGHDGPGPLGGPARKTGQVPLLPGGHRRHRIDLPRACRSTNITN